MIAAPVAIVSACLLAVVVGGAFMNRPATPIAASVARPTPATSAAPSATVVTTPADGGDTLTLVTAGIVRTVPNGSDVPVGGGLLATLTVKPGDERYSRQLDIYLHDSRVSPAAVDGATILGTGRMRFMDHGTFRQVAEVASDGHYVLPLTFPMPGEWEIELQIDGPRDRGKVTLNVDLFD